MYIDGTGYKIFIEKDEFVNLREYLEEEASGKRIFVLADENVAEHCLPIIQDLLSNGNEVKVHVVKPGESTKNMDVVMECCKFLADHRANRDALLVNLGGGVVIDLGGLVASLYKRGIDCIQIPTTLLAQIDASVGGKTGIDAFGIKNLVGTFSMPKGVFIYPGFLKTLDDRQIKAGFAEALKHALIENKGYWNYLKGFDFSGYDRMIFKSVEIKDKLVDRDPHESGQRKKLNYGHTIGHAVESYYVNRDSDEVLHGEAVAAGIIMEAYISNKVQGLPDNELQEIVEVVKKSFKHIAVPEDSHKELLDYMHNDKKNTNGEINFTLLDTIGESSFNRIVEEPIIEEAIHFYRENA